VSRPVQASEVLTISAISVTIPAATRLSRSGWAKAPSHTGAGALPGPQPGSGIRPST